MQIELLKSRGMQITDYNKACHYLSNISYYRLSAYWFTFLKKPQNLHVFIEGTTFDKVKSTYIFDRKLRLLIFDEIERIEIAIRTQLIYHYTLAYGNNWYEDSLHYRHQDLCEKLVRIFKKEMDGTNETFIKHYKSKYFSPENPPAWMTIEIASFGQLSMLFKNLRTCDARKATAKHFGVSEIVLESWLETLSFVRNTCAHHSRLWNRKLPKRPIIPDRAADKWLEILPETDKLNRIYIVLSIIRYMIKRINPGTTFPSRLKQLLSDYPEIPLHYMGFPNEWEGDKFWL